MAATQRISLSVAGVRVRTIPRTGSFRIECTTVIHNGTRVPIEGSLSFAKLPVGWRTAEPELIVAAIEPGSSRKATLVVEASSMGWGAGGVTHLLVQLRTRQGRTLRATARLAYVTSQRRGTPITLDGDFSEWTTGVGNVASGFVSIAGEALVTGNTVDDGRGDATTCFVSHDDRNVYFAIRCKTSPDLPTSRVRRNDVHYDDQIPTEELVELLIDPTGIGTHDVGDLYHVVIKRTGAAVFERGVCFADAAERRRVWTADIRYAVRVTPDAWSVELRIPRAALDQETTGPHIWGVNMTRFHERTCDFRNWSGATRNVYDPASLGNLMLP